MKKIQVLLTLFICLFALSFNAQAQTKTKTTKTTKTAKEAKVAKVDKYENVSYKVNIHCEDCKREIESNIPFQKGVKDVKVDMSTNVVTVNFDPKKTDSDIIKKAFEKLDFKAEKIS